MRILGDSLRGRWGDYRHHSYYKLEGAPVCDLVQGIIDEKSRHIFGGDYESCGSAESSIHRWQNPAGGSPSDVNHDASYVGEPIGSALSTR